MNEILVKFAEQFVLLLIPIVTPLLVAWLVGLIRKNWKELKLVQPDIAYALQTIVPIVVRAAEQSKAMNFIQDKKKYALQMTQQWLEAQGFHDVDINLIDAAIEGAVYEEFKKYGPILEPALLEQTSEPVG